VHGEFFLLLTQKAVVCTPRQNIKELPGDTGLLPANEVPEDTHRPVNKTDKLFFEKENNCYQ
jgi:hypothetical protein